jgi:hypothetical protein
VDCKIADALLKKGTKQHAEGWDASRKAWTQMVLHLPHAEGGFGITFNDVTKDAAFYTTTCLSHRSMLGLVVDSAPRAVFLSIRGCSPLHPVA